jgi:hypothetical protein
MKVCCRIVAVGAMVLTGGFATPLAAQEIALKGGISISRFQSTGIQPFDGRFVSTSFGGHARFGFGRIALQPELQIVSRGATASGSALEERMRIDYMEVPLMVVVPFAIGSFEPYAFGGPMVSLETRCRSIIEEDNLKTNFDCDDTSGGSSFDRRTVDFGASAGAGVSHRLGSGRLLLEGRHTWGLRNIYDGAEEGVEVRNRSVVISIGYAILTGEM